MKDMTRRIFIVLALLMLQACSIVNYQLRDTLSSKNQQNMGLCDIKFSLVTESAFHTNTFGAENTENNKLKEIQSKYIIATNEALHSLGCKATYSENAESSSLKINIKRQPQLSALPQEWLTGLSLGLIPSWGTRPAEFIYSFTNKGTGKSYSYTVDNKSFNHLILFPVFWISFYTADEYKTYKNAITNFVKNS